MPATGMLHVRMNNDIKAKGTAALEAMGLTAADAVRILFHRIVADQAFPLELKVPNAETRGAMADADAMMADHRARFSDTEAVFADLDGQGR